VWHEPLVSIPEGQFRLMSGEQAMHSHTLTANIEPLMAITEAYDLTRVWMNATRAQELGISDGDLIEIRTSEAHATVRVKVTERIHPEGLFLPDHYGSTSTYLKQAYQVGVGHMQFVPFKLETGTGAPLKHEVAVTVRKVNS
jgi:thiosulfate reductase/polysulfide reductase chain A